MSGNTTDWVASKINPRDGLAIIDRPLEDLLLVQYRDNEPFALGVTGVANVILPEHVEPLLSQNTKPQFIVNVPSKALWSGDTISLIHSVPAAFGTFGDIARAASSGNVTSFRNKNWAFFEQGIEQHSNVHSITRVYDEVFEAHRRKGDDLRIALVEGYHVSAEDVRNARNRFGHFDIAVKKTSYGSITDAAEQAAASMGAEVVTFKGLMRRLAK